MKVSELLADLKNRADQAQIIVVESDAPDNPLTIESVVGGNEKSVILMGKSTRVGFRPLVEASMQGGGQIHNTKIFKSAMQPGKFQVSIDGLTLMQHFETQADAHLFLMGFSFGFATGSGSKSPAAVDR
jgi:hypothetical protein